MVKILVIEDEISLREEILDILETEGFDVSGAEDGSAGLQLAKTQQPDLILCDVMMPNTDGYQVLSSLRQHSDTALVPLIFLTAKGTHANVRQGMNLGADDYLIKPFKVEELLEAIAARLARQEAILQTQQSASFWDALTQLPNKPYLIKHLNQLIEQTTADSTYQYAVLFVGLDRLRAISDAFGQKIGERFIQTMAFQLRNILAPEHYLFYFGSDEFIIILENIQAISVAYEQAQHLYEWSLNHPFELEGCEVFSRISIGITHSQLSYNSAIELLSDAALAMHHARTMSQRAYEPSHSPKAALDHKFVVFEPAMRTSLSDQLQLETDLRRAILAGTYGSNQHEFCLYYQPIICLATYRLVGFEALIRWNHPTRGVVSPNQFIPVAEANGLIDELGWWVIQEACHQLRMWQQQLPQCWDLVMNINVSPLQLKQSDFSQRLAKILSCECLPGKNIKLEVTESCLLERTESTDDILQSLKLLDIQLCIDDFGTGYSCLSRLHQLPIDTLKIDRSFISQLKLDSQNSIVQAIISLANSLDINLVAEGIETLYQLEILKSLNCELGQGYFFSQPLTKQDAYQFIIDLGSQLEVSWS